MKILAEYKKEKVYIVATRQNGFCDIVRTAFNILKKDFTGALSTVQAKDLTIIDSEYIVPIEYQYDVHGMKKEEQELANKYANMTPKELQELVDKSDEKDKAARQRFNKMTEEELKKYLTKLSKKENAKEKDVEL